MLDKAYFCYMTASKSRVIYIGMTSSLRQRMWRHKTREFVGFTDRYNCDRLVWAEMFPDSYEAINRERQLKRWRREKKVALIEAENPKWDDLTAEWYDEADIARARAFNESRRALDPAD
jgi:putative endonuclease